MLEGLPLGESWESKVRQEKENKLLEKKGVALKTFWYRDEGVIPDWLLVSLLDVLIRVQ